MLQTQRYGIQVSRYTRHKQTNKQTNKPTDYYTRGRPRAPRVIIRNYITMTIILWFVRTSLGMLASHSTRTKKN